jgi:hypothetical protein
MKSEVPQRSIYLHTSVCIVSPSINEGLESLAIDHLRFIFLSLVPLSFRLGSIELGKVSVFR